MPRKLTLQQRIFIVSKSKDTPFAAMKTVQRMECAIDHGE